MHRMIARAPARPPRNRRHRLPGVLEVVVAAKDAAKKRFRAAATPPGKVVAALLVWLVLFGSKFVVLEAVGLVFGSRVSLGGFFSVSLLILVLVLSRALVRRLLQGEPALGRPWHRRPGVRLRPDQTAGPGHPDG